MAAFTLVGFAVVREVAERGSFTAAAAVLGYTQSAVSRQVAAIEEAAGAALFERTRRGVRLTDAGRSLLVHAAAALDHAAAARRELATLGDAKAVRLRLGAFPTAIAALVPRALSALADECPRVEVILREGTTPVQLRRVRSGSSDIAVIGSVPGLQIDRSGLTITPLLEDQLLLAVARTHRLAARRAVELEELATERWVTGSTDRNDALLGVWPGVSWQPRIEFVARDWTAKLGLVAAGLGVAIVPGLAATSVPPGIALVRVRTDAPATRTVAAVTPAHTEPPPFAAALIELLECTGAELAGEVHKHVQQG